MVGIFPLTPPPQPEYWRECVPGIPGGVDASECIQKITSEYYDPPPIYVIVKLMMMFVSMLHVPRKSL